MRHAVAGFKLGRNTPHRRAMWRNMAVSLFTHGQITTTVPKAKSLQPFVERLITAARKGDLASRRRVIRELGGDRVLVDFDPTLRDRKQMEADGYKVNKYHEILDGPKVVKKLFDEIGPSFTDRAGGYTRIVRLGKHRLGDGGDLCVIQLVREGEQEKHHSSSRRRKQADRRAAFAAQLRRGGKDDGGQSSAAVEDAPGGQAPVVDDTVEQSSAEATADERVETSGEKPGEPDVADTAEGSRTRSEQGEDQQKQ